MTNRDKLLSMSLYDMLVSMNTSGECCVIDSLGGIIEVVPQRCDHYANCSKCIEDFLNEGGNTKMYIGKKWMTESEVQAYVAELEKKIAEAEDKHENECRQISEYDIEVRTLREQQNARGKLERITASYTFGQQRAVFIEECAEAIQASCKLERASNSSPEEYEQRRKALISEIADVIIMAEQMRLYLGAEKVDAEILRKLDRQLQRIREEVNTENE